jgi:serine/threonine protein kinase/tetratricopeptide (TPR) repeat protein
LAGLTFVSHATLLIVKPGQFGEGSDLPQDLPRKIGSYRIERRLGAGGMGIVYRAFDEALERPLAIKHVRPDGANPNAARRLRREAQTAARLNHPNIVHIYDIVQGEAGDWIVMELVEGVSLVRMIRDGLDLDQAVRIGREIADGLAEAHSQGVVHRDLKAGNVMVTASGHAKILDFGLAKLAASEPDADLSQVGIVLGTAYAMSPEQVQGLPLDHRSDLFSLGSLLYEMLTGVSPFRVATTHETLSRVCHHRPPPVSMIRPEIAEDLSDLIDWLLCKQPGERPADTSQVAARLRALEAAATGRAGESPGAPGVRPERRAERTSEGSTLLDGRAALRREPVSTSEKLLSGPRPTSERRQVTVVGCELVGLDRAGGPPRPFDPETLHELMLRLRALAEGVASRYDGRLASSLGGSRLLIVFGVPLAHEDSARRAVRAALQLVDEAPRMSADPGSKSPALLALRVGIHTGPAVVATSAGDREAMTLGATLDLAVELQSRAEPGSVVVSPATAALIERSFALAALPAVEVPGLGSPLRPFRVLEAAEGSSAVHLPLVGREPELALLLDRWGHAREGNGQVVLLSGEAGIGKSALMLALRERLGSGVAAWWACFASPYTQGSPLQPIVGPLRQILLPGTEAGSLDRLASSLGELGLADTVALFAPLLDLPLDERYPVPPLSPQRRQEKTLEALEALILELAERRPLILLIEDLHWLDRTSLDLLDRLIDRAREAPLLLLLTLRPHTLETLWGPRGHLTPVALQPLGSADAERLVEQVMGGRSLPEPVRRRIVARTDGVPLFLEELTRAVLEAPGAGERQELPATLRDSLAERLDRLGSAKAVAQIAAVIGRAFRFDLLAAVCAGDAAELQLDLRRLVQAELVHRKGVGTGARYLFKHALVQDAAYESLLERERRQIHRRIAETIEERFAAIAETTPEILAHHYTQAGLSEAAIGSWIRAASLATRRSASSEALDHLDRALRLLPDLPESPERDRTELQIQKLRAAAVIFMKGYVDPAVEHAHARAAVLAERLEDAQESFWAALGLATSSIVIGNLERGGEVTERLLRIAQDEGRRDFLALAWFYRGAYHLWHGDYADSLSELETAYELTPPPPEEPTYRMLSSGADPRVVILSHAAMALLHLGRFDLARERVEKAIAFAREIGSPFSLGFAGSHGAFVGLLLHDVEAVARIAGEVHHFAVELGFSHWEWLTALHRVWAELQTPDAGQLTIDLGDFAAVLGTLAKNAGAMPYYYCLHAEILIRQERLDDAWRALDEGLRLIQARGWQGHGEEIYRLQGELLLRGAAAPEGVAEDGRTAEAERLFQQALEQARGHGDRLLGLRAALSLARLRRGQNRAEEARDLVTRACEGLTGGAASRDFREAEEFLG